MRKQGLQYLEARNGLEALLTYQKGEHKIDVILMGKHLRRRRTSIMSPEALDLRLTYV